MSSTHDPSPTVRIQHCKFPGCDVFLGVNFPSDWCGEHQQVGPLVARVVDLWNVGDGWIPAASRDALASALGIPEDALRKPNYGRRRSHDDRLMPHHLISDAPGSSIPSPLDKNVCKAVTKPGYVHENPDGSLHCNNCGWETT
jgi:hypothetical protein